MREVFLLWGFTVATLAGVAVVLVLAVGVVFGAGWLAWRTLRFAAAMLSSFIGRNPVMPRKGESGGGVTWWPDNPRVPRRLWFAGRRPDAGVQAGLVPAAPCVAHGGVARLERRRPAGPRSRRD